MAAGVQKAWSTTAGSNGSADANINFAEGQQPASLNNGARAQMAAIKAFANQILGALTSGGSANAQTLTSDAPGAISTAYGAGMGFVFRAGYTNSGACTLNVDGVGAKSIKKGGALAALAANDIVAGGIYFVVYQATGDCFVLLNPESGQIAAQPLDATLTAVAALSWSSGSPLLQFTAADTVSLTLTPSVTSVTASQGAANTTASGTFINTTDNASVKALRIEGDRATPTNNDNVYMSYYLSNSAGTQTEMARIYCLATSVTAGAEGGRLEFWAALAGTMASRMVLQPNASAFYPSTNDSLALGAGTAAWSDLYLASGGVFNFNNGNVVAAHVTGGLDFTTGALASPTLASSETTGALTSASRNRRVVCSGGVTLPASGMTTGDWVLIDPAGTARTITRPAAHTMYIRDTDSATGTSFAHNVALAVYHGSSKWTLHGVT